MSVNDIVGMLSLLVEDHMLLYSWWKSIQNISSWIWIRCHFILLINDTFVFPAKFSVMWCNTFLCW